MSSGSESESELLSEKYDSLVRGFGMGAGEKFGWGGVGAMGREGTSDGVWGELGRGLERTMF